MLNMRRNGRFESNKKMILLSIFLAFYVMLIIGCATTPMQTPNPNNSSLMLPEQIMLEGIKIERGQSFRDCVPVVLEAVFKFYGKNIDRKEIDDKIHKGWGTKIKDMLEYAKEQGFSSYSFIDETQDKRKIKFFLAQRFPVLVTVKRFSGGWQGHIVILIGYDDRKKIFHFADPERRATKQERYLDFNEWHELTGSYGCVIYPPSQSIQKLSTPTGYGVPKISNLHFVPPEIKMSEMTSIVFDYNDDDADMDRIHVFITYPDQPQRGEINKGEWRMNWAGKSSGTARYRLNPGYFTTVGIHRFTIQLIDKKGNISNSLQADVNVTAY